MPGRHINDHQVRLYMTAQHHHPVIKRHREPIHALPHVNCYQPTSSPQVVCYRRTRAWEATGWYDG